MWGPLAAALCYALMAGGSYIWRQYSGWCDDSPRHGEPSQAQPDLFLHLPPCTECIRSTGVNVLLTPQTFQSRKKWERGGRLVALASRGVGRGQAKESLRQVQSGDRAIGPGMKRKGKKEDLQEEIEDKQREKLSRPRRESRSV